MSLEEDRQNRKLLCRECKDREECFIMDYAFNIQTFCLVCNNIQAICSYIYTCNICIHNNERLWVGDIIFEDIICFVLLCYLAYQNEIIVNDFDESFVDHNGYRNGGNCRYLKKLTAALKEILMRYSY